MRRPLPVVVGLLLLAVLIAVLVAVGAWQGDLDRGPGIEGLPAAPVVPAVA